MDHINESKKHKENKRRRVEEAETQSGVDLQEQFILDVLTTFATAGISYEKLHFFQRLFAKWVPSVGGTVPAGSWVREKYLDKLLPAQQAAIRFKVEKASSLSIIVDESTDCRHEHPVNFMFQLSGPVYSKPILVDMKFVSELNVASIDSTALAWGTTQVINDFVNDNGRISAMVGDGAAYNLACYEKLKPMIPQMIYVRCWCHILSLVGDAVRESLELVDVSGFISFINKYFKNAPRRRHRWLSHLKESGVLNPKMITRFNKTRWNSWFNTVQSITTHFQHIKHFLLKEKDEVSRNKKTLENLIEIVNDNRRMFLLRMKLEFLCENFNSLITAIKSFQAHQILAHTVYSTIQGIKDALSMW